MERVQGFVRDGGAPIVDVLGARIRQLGAGAGPSDRRIWPRYNACLDIWITYEQAGTVVRAKTANISQGGFYITIGAKVDLDPRQQPRVRIFAPKAFQNRPEQGTGESRPESKVLIDCQAKMAHGELLLGEDDYQVGAGFEFDRPHTIELPETSARLGPISLYPT